MQRLSGKHLVSVCLLCLATIFLMVPEQNCTRAASGEWFGAAHEDILRGAAVFLFPSSSLRCIRRSLWRAQNPVGIACKVWDLRFGVTAAAPARACAQSDFPLLRRADPLAVLCGLIPPRFGERAHCECDNWAVCLALKNSTLPPARLHPGVSISL